VILHEVAQDLPDPLFARGDDGGVGNRQAKRVPNSAVHRKPSASPPTRDASAVARTYPSQGNCASYRLAATNTSSAIASKPVARRFMASSRACRSASSGRDQGEVS